MATGTTGNFPAATAADAADSEQSVGFSGKFTAPGTIIAVLVTALVSGGIGMGVASGKGEATTAINLPQPAATVPALSRAEVQIEATTAAASAAGIVREESRRENSAQAGATAAALSRIDAKFDGIDRKLDDLHDAVLRLQKK